MEFGSSYVYWYDEPEFEVISDEEMEEGMELSDSSSGSDSDTQTNTENFKFKKHNWRKVNTSNLYANQSNNASGRTVRKADTNIVSIDFSLLKTPGSLFTGDPVYCNGCKALLSHISKVTKHVDQQVWTCEFCETSNNIHVLDEEVPRDADVTFMLEPAPSTTAADAAISEGDNSLVIFCVDVSSSMNDTIEVPGKIDCDFLPQQGNSSWRRSGYDQLNNVTYLSRLMAVQLAVQHQLEEMMKNYPNRRVALITFGDEVTFVEVGKSKHKKIRGSVLDRKSKLVDIGKELNLPRAVKDTGKELKEKVQSLIPHGCTALGPALVISVTMAASCRGSKIILCTDGMANEGVGRVNYHDDEGERFYQELGNEAARNGTSISVISFKGTDCKLVHLGKMADQTEGQVNIVDPRKLTKEFSSVLAGQITATNAEATVVLHKQLCVKNDGKEESRIEKQIGIVTDGTVLTFEYGIKAPQNIPEKVVSETDNAQNGIQNQMDVDETCPQIPDEMPFQLQVRYTDKEGATVLRVFTHLKPATKDRKAAEKDANIQVIGANVQKEVASMALDGSYTDSRVKALTNQRLVWRHKMIADDKINRKDRKKKYKKIFKNISKLEHRIRNEQKREIQNIGRNLSESEGSDDDDADGMVRGRSRSRERKQKKKQMRHSVMTDGFSHAVYRSRQCRSLSRSRSRSRSPPLRRQRRSGSPPYRGQRRRFSSSGSRSPPLRNQRRLSISRSPSLDRGQRRRLRRSRSPSISGQSSESDFSSRSPSRERSWSPVSPSLFTLIRDHRRRSRSRSPSPFRGQRRRLRKSRSPSPTYRGQRRRIRKSRSPSPTYRGQRSRRRRSLSGN